jgi:hypothetical protein
VNEKLLSKVYNSRETARQAWRRAKLNDDWVVRQRDDGKWIIARRDEAPPLLIPREIIENLALALLGADWR